MKVLVSDKLAEDGLAKLRAHADLIQLEVKVGLAPADLKAILGGFEGIVIRSATKLNSDVLDAASSLKAIVRAGVGVDNVDLEYAKRKGIAVMNTPAGSTNAVAELALALMVSLARHIAAADAAMKSEKWEKKALEGSELGGKTLGLIGLGRIGRKLGQYARGMGMSVVGFDPLVTGEVEGVRKVTLDELYAASDYISFHVPLTRETYHMISAKTLPQLKKGVRLINCARGGVIDEAAVLAGIESGAIAGAGIDVWEKEPPANWALAKHPKVIALPHLGASSAEAQASVSTEAAEVMIHFARTGEFLNRVA